MAELVGGGEGLVRQCRLRCHLCLRPKLLRVSACVWRADGALGRSPAWLSAV
jgi:hypothetical protein